jgi:hypothetical protein
MRNVYFELTREFNRDGVIAVLGSGQAVVHYRIAMMSKDGDWILRESLEACARVLEVLEGHGARYRPGAPLDVRWLAGGWSSHFEFLDEKRRRVRCDFFSRPPRVPFKAVEALFARGGKGELRVVGLLSLIRMKQTQRAKDYPVIGELARLLPPEEEIEYTTDPDRIIDLAAAHGAGSLRPPVLAALRTGSRKDVVVELAKEVDEMQEKDRKRLERYDRASRSYLHAFHERGMGGRSLGETHPALVSLAKELLPPEIGSRP